MLDNPAQESHVVKPKRYRHGNLPNALRIAARDILNEGDIPALREVARRVGVSATAAYRHYESFDALMRAVAIEGFGELANAVEVSREIDPTDGPGAYIRFANDNAGLFRLMFSEENREVVFFSDAVSEALGGLDAWPRIHGLASLVVAGRLALDEAVGRAA